MKYLGPHPDVVCALAGASFAPFDDRPEHPAVGNVRGGPRSRFTKLALWEQRTYEKMRINMSFNLIQQIRLIHALTISDFDISISEAE